MLTFKIFITIGLELLGKQSKVRNDSFWYSSATEKGYILQLLHIFDLLLYLIYASHDPIFILGAFNNPLGTFKHVNMLLSFTSYPYSEMI